MNLAGSIETTALTKRYDSVLATYDTRCGYLRLALGDYEVTVFFSIRIWNGGELRNVGLLFE